MPLRAEPRKGLGKEQLALLRIMVVFANDQSTDLQRSAYFRNFHGMEFADDHAAML